MIGTTLKVLRGGFSLIELMIVLTIIATLAALAIPAYQDFAIRAQVAEALNLIGPLQYEIADYAWKQRNWPPSVAALSLNIPSGKYIGGIAVSNGTIQIAFGGEINSAVAGTRLDIRPGLSANGDILWSCGYAPAPVSLVTYSPVYENGSGVGAPSTPNGTTIPARYLPAPCRS